MKILIDLSYINSLDSGGKTQFSFILLKGILKTDDRNEYIIMCNNTLIDYINKKFPMLKTVGFNGYNNVRNKYMNLFMSLVYKNFIYPYLIKREKPDVIFFHTKMFVYLILIKVIKPLCFPMIYNLYQIPCDGSYFQDITTNYFTHRTLNI